MKSVRTLVTLAALLAAGSTAFAQTAISQVKGMSFPVTLSSPGSYKLTSNLVVPANSHGIVISSPNVTLDLNGFTISGPVSCASAGVCNMAQAGFNGISASVPNTVIRNGTVKGFQGAGIQIAGSSAVEEMLVTENAGVGLVGGNQLQGTTLVNRVRSTLNKSFGVYLFSSIVNNSMATANGQGGYYLNTSSLIDSAASGNIGTGVFGGSHLMVRGTRADSNTSADFGGNFVSGGANMSDWTLF
jgi:hypothetical protein